MFTPNSETLFQRSLRVAPGGVHSPVRAFKSVGGTPIFFQSGAGARLHSVEGDSYIDFCQAFGPLILGHRDPEVHEAVVRAMEGGWALGTCEPYSLTLAEWIVERVKHVEKIRFVSSGTEAVMSALRVARAVTGRAKVLKFEGCYHGHADSMLVKGGSGLAGTSASDSAGITDPVIADTLVAPLDDLEAVNRIFQVHGASVAALIIEPLPANYGLLIQRREFLHAVAALAKKHGSLLIFDEVISGFRVALGGMAEVLGMTPDLVTYGKILGGGFPVGAYGGRAALLDWVAPSGPVYQAGTLSANPVGMQAGLATLRKLEQSRAHAVLETAAASFTDALSQIFRKRGAPYQVRRVGSIFWIHPETTAELRSLRDLPVDLNARFTPLFRALLRAGIYLPPSGYEVGFLGLAHTDEVLSEALEKIRRAVAELS